MTRQIKHIRHSKRGKLFVAGNRKMCGAKIRTVRVKTYEYDDLSQEAKGKALEKFYDINVDYNDWFGDFPFEDLKEIGLKSTNHTVYFDLDRGDYLYFDDVVIDRIQKFIKSAGIKISSGKGKKLIDDYNNGGLRVVTKLYGGSSGANYVSSDNASDADLEELNETLKNKLQKIKSDLRKAYDYSTSKEAIEETIRINEYQFGKNGEFPARV